MRIQALEPLPPHTRPAPGQYAAGNCHGCHGNTARWLISFQRNRPFLKLCAKCASFLSMRLGEMIQGRVIPQSITHEVLEAMEDDNNRGNR